MFEQFSQRVAGLAAIEPHTHAGDDQFAVALLGQLDGFGHGGFDAFIAGGFA